MNFDQAFDCVIGAEGGYVNDPRDPGGETKYGISKRAYPNEDIRNLTLDRARQIYWRDYWGACKCDSIPAPLNLYVFDAAVNQGVSAAIRALQGVLGLAQDGIIGPQTIAAASVAGSEKTALYLADRAIRYAKTANFDTYGRGWMKRLFMLAREA